MEQETKNRLPESILSDEEPQIVLTESKFDERLRSAKQDGWHEGYNACHRGGSRIPLGTYHIWIAKLARWYFNKKKPESDRWYTRLVFRGRGSRVRAEKKGARLNFDRDLPIKYARFVAIYLVTERKRGER
jgi:hypothetical protein